MAIQFSEIEKATDITHVVRLSKPSINQLNEMKMKQQIEAIIVGASNPARTNRGWKIEIARQGYDFYLREYNYNNSHEGQYTYHVDLTITCKPGRLLTDHVVATDFQNTLNTLAAKAKFPGKWTITLVDSKPYVSKAIDEQQAENTDVGYAPLTIPEDWDTYFSHLYGLEAHINRVKRALDGTVITGWEKRLHCALIGPPGCGKSDIVHSIKKAVGEESVLEFDATATTMAGAIEDIKNREELPRILLVEEIEKAPENALPWLLSVLDLRGEIRKRTARGQVLKDTKMIAIATVNDLPTFQKLAFGALASRFANKIYFNRPDRALLGKILEREVEKINGNPDWITPTLDFAAEMDTTDPREVMSLMLCGRDSLLDNTFQTEMRWTTPQFQANGSKR